MLKMIVRNLLIFLILIINTQSFSQTPDSLFGKILIAPFRPDLYYNEQSAESIGASDFNYDQLKNFYRLQLDKCITDSLPEASSLLTSVTITAEGDILHIYENINYKMEICPRENDKKLPALFTNKEKKDKGRTMSTEQKKGNQGELVSERKSNNNKFVSSVFSTPRIISTLLKDYKSDFLLIINQFEIKGDYSNPTTTINKTYDWKIIIHYDVYNRTGEKIYGNKQAIKNQ